MQATRFTILWMLTLLDYWNILKIGAFAIKVLNYDRIEALTFIEVGS
jgi:hypothetical protein